MKKSTETRAATIQPDPAPAVTEDVRLALAIVLGDVIAALSDLSAQARGESAPAVRDACAFAMGVTDRAVADVLSAGAS